MVLENIHTNLNKEENGNIISSGQTLSKAWIDWIVAVRLSSEQQPNFLGQSRQMQLVSNRVLDMIGVR